MAEFKEKFFGKISGSFGDFIGVVRGEDNFIIRKKADRKVDTSPEGIERRNKFGVAIKVSRTINSIPETKAVWASKADGRKTAYNYCIQHNYGFVTGSGSVNGLSLFPGFGFAFSLDTFTRDETGITAVVAPLINSINFDTSVEKTIKAFFLVELNDPVNPEGRKVTFFLKSSVALALDLENPLTFNISFLSTEAELISGYTTVKVFTAFCTLNDDNEPVQYSATTQQ